MNIRPRVASGALVTMTILAQAANGQTATVAAPFDLPAQSLSSTLRAIGKTTGRQILISAASVKGRDAPALHGRYTADQAVQIAMAGSGIQVQFRTDAILVGAAETGATPGSLTDQIVVTGTHIRGEHPAAPVISISREKMLNAGEANLGDVVRNIPQNFSGGQNPNVILSTPAAQGNGNLNAASTINLRGLGADATLTLINGHRISYDGASQAVDISTIPVAAIDRLEIVADGSSALYGSDAVGGVANIILRRDFDGIETDARLGGATQGGDFQQQYDLVTGRKWTTGGFIITYDYQRTSAINAGQRSITQNVNETTTLLPYQKQHSAILSGHQSIGPDFDFTIDATFDHRNSADSFSNDPAEAATVTGRVRSQSTTGFSLAPRMKWHAPHNWLIDIAGVYGRDRTEYSSTSVSDGAFQYRIPGRYTNTTKTIELSGEGPLFELPGGSVRLALGAGHRDIGLVDYAEEIDPSTRELLVDEHHTRSSNYGYAELFVPLVEPGLGIHAVNRIELTGAVRYESYNNIESVATPKLGLIYEPVAALVFHGTWGKSFKTPTLYQQYDGYFGDLLPPGFFGATNLPAGSTVLYSSGSNTDLKPERATSWTVGAKVKPEAVRGLAIDGSFFRIDYRNRIIAPPLSFNGLLSNPLDDPFITRSPDASLIDSVIAGSSSPLTNLTGTDFDPTKVAAYIDDRLQNIARQRIDGIDLSLTYDRDLGSHRSVNLEASATYLHATQQLTAGAATVPTSGVIYYPPKWRARGGGSWADNGFSASAFINYIGPVLDNSEQPFVRVHSMTTVDAVLRVASPNNGGVLRGINMTIALTNIFDAKPGRVRVSDLSLYPAYDSTNYSVVGRVISVTLGKRW